MNQNEQNLREALEDIATYYPNSWAADRANQVLSAEPESDMCEFEAMKQDLEGYVSANTQLLADIAELETSNAKLRVIAERGAEFEAKIIRAKAQPLAKLTEDQVLNCFDNSPFSDDPRRNVLYFANAIMDAMQAKNSKS
jgi:hypothetical protein